MKEDVVEEVAPDRERRPLSPAYRTPVPGRLTLHKEPCEAQPRGQSAHGDLPPSPVHVSKPPRTSALVVEMDCAKAALRLRRQARQHDAYVVFGEVVNPVTARWADGEADLPAHGVLVMGDILSRTRLGLSHATQRLWLQAAGATCSAGAASCKASGPGPSNPTAKAWKLSWMASPAREFSDVSGIPSGRILASLSHGPSAVGQAALGFRVHLSG